MLTIEAIDVLPALRAALGAPEAQRLDLFRTTVMEPLRPFWEPFMGRMPQPPPGDTDDPAMTAARMFGYYSPELGADRGLEALDRLERADSVQACIAALQRGWSALVPEAHGIAFEAVRFTLVLGNPETMNPKSGYYTGFGGAPGVVLVMAWPTDFNLPRLPAAAAHELNHNIRFSFEPFTLQTTLGQYMVGEGLAEAFAVEICGEETVGPFAEALSDEEVAAVVPRFRDNLDLAGFNEIRAYIFGDWAAEGSGYTAQGIPDFAGYTIGYRLVRAYLERSGKTAAEATYVPWREIVEESRFF